MPDSDARGSVPAGPASAAPKRTADTRHRRHAERQLRKDLFISALALVSVGIGVYDLSRARVDARFTWLDGVDLGIVTIFIVDFVGSAIRSGNGRAYVRRHWYEIPSLLPITGNMVAGAEAVPLLRSLRLVRLVRVARLLRVIGAAARLRSFWRTAFRIARRAHLGALAAFAGLVIVVGAGLVWLVEGAASANFADAGDALWWAVNMFSNVAYVDFHPQTTGGRIVAALLEFTGIAFIGLFTASLAGAMLTDKGAGEEEEGPSLPLE
jgi:hypothetical protein